MPCFTYFGRRPDGEHVVIDLNHCNSDGAAWRHAAALLADHGSLTAVEIRRDDIVVGVRPRLTPPPPSRERPPARSGCG